VKLEMSVVARVSGQNEDKNLTERIELKQDQTVA